MIHLIPTEAKRFRTFGWVQDPSDFRSLCDVVAIFDETSLKHQELAGQVIPALVEERDGRQRLLDALNQRPLRISYTDLVGTSFTPRSAARCNGIVQAAVRGQVRPFIGDWPADNFVRWAHALGFLRYGYQGDAFELTETGKALAQARTQGGAEFSGKGAAHLRCFGVSSCGEDLEPFGGGRGRAPDKI